MYKLIHDILYYKNLSESLDCTLNESVNDNFSYFVLSLWCKQMQYQLYHRMNKEKYLFLWSGIIYIVWNILHVIYNNTI